MTAVEIASAKEAQAIHHQRLNRHFTDKASLWFLRYGYIKDSDGIVTRWPALKLRVVQKKMFDYYDECLSAKKPCLEIVCKPRKDGASTAAQAMNYHRLRRYAGRAGALMGDIQGTSDQVFEIFRTFALNDGFQWPDGLGALRVEDKTGNLTDDITLPNQSTFKKVTAGSTNANRSGTIQVANATEVSYYPSNPDRDPMTGFIGSWNENGESSLGILDSTSNGPFGTFYEYFMDERNGWHKIFVGWQEEPDHILPFANSDEEKKFLRDMDKETREVMERLGVTLLQMHWRHQKLVDKCGGSIETLNKEYPATIEDAFLQKSALRFNISVLNKLERIAEVNKPANGSLMTQQDGSVSFQPDDGGDIELHEQPRIGCKYLGTWDSCTGKDQQAQGKNREPDWHSIQILRAPYLDQFGQSLPVTLAAHHYSRLEVEVAAEIAAAMSRFYGKCLFVVEVNGCGLYPVKKLQELGVPLWERQRKNPSTGQIDVSAGWFTNEVIRRTIIDNLAGKVLAWKPEEPTLEIRSLRVIGEMKTFATQDGKPQAMPGTFDDTVLALAIGVQNITCATEMKEFRRKAVTVEKLLRRQGWRMLNAVS